MTPESITNDLLYKVYEGARELDERRPSSSYPSSSYTVGYFASLIEGAIYAAYNEGVSRGIVEAAEDDTPDLEGMAERLMADGPSAADLSTIPPQNVEAQHSNGCCELHYPRVARA